MSYVLPKYSEPIAEISLRKHSTIYTCVECHYTQRERVQLFLHPAVFQTPRKYARTHPQCHPHTRTRRNSPPLSPPPPLSLSHVLLTLAPPPPTQCTERARPTGLSAGSRHTSRKPATRHWFRFVSRVTTVCAHRPRTLHVSCEAVP